MRLYHFKETDSAKHECLQKTCELNMSYGGSLYTAAFSYPPSANVFISFFTSVYSTHMCSQP